MNEEEKRGRFTRREKKLLNVCRIKSKEQFLCECKMSGIRDDRYAFVCDRSKPVSMDTDTVTTTAIWTAVSITKPLRTAA